MKTIGKIKDKLQNVTLSFDAFTTAYTCMLLFFFAPYCSTVCDPVVLAFAPLAFLIPFAVTPLICALIYRFNPLLFGRYHLFMPLSAMVGAVFFVLAFGARSGGDATLVFFALMFFIVAHIMYKYCSYSVGARLGGPSSARLPERNIFALIGAALAFLSVYCFYSYDSATVFLNSAYLAGGLCLITSLIQYLTTVNETPRLSGRRAQSVKNMFRMFYAELDMRIFLSSSFFYAAFFCAAGMTVFYLSALGMPAYICVTAAAVIAATFGLGYALADRMIKRRSVALSIAILVLFAIGVILFSVTVACTADTARIGCIMPAAVCIGAGGALCARQTDMRFLSIKPKATGGVVNMLIRLSRCGAAAVALIPTAIACIVYKYTGAAACFSYAVIAAVAFAIAGFVLARRTAQSVAVKEPVEELNSEERQPVQQIDGLITGNDGSDSDADIDAIIDGSLEANDEQ